MPQMAPYNWFILFMLMNLINFIIISINYYMFVPKFNCSPPQKFYSTFNFKW